MYTLGGQDEVNGVLEKSTHALRLNKASPS